MINLFDKVNENLFVPLASPNKKEHFDILMLLWERCEKDPMHTIDKKEAIDVIEHYVLLKEEEIKERRREEGVEILKPAREMGRDYLMTLRNAGWLNDAEQEYGKDARLEINNEIIPIIEAFKKIIKPESITYSGKLYKIYVSLCGIKKQKTPYQKGLKEAYNDVQEFNKTLQYLLNSLKGLINELLKDKKDPLKVLELLKEYDRDFIDKHYQHFKTDENIFKYRQELLYTMYDCNSEDELFNRLLKDYMEEEGEKDKNIATKKLREIIDGMIEEINRIETLMNLIDIQHQTYIRKAIQRADFLSDSDNTIKDKINRLLQFYTTSIIDVDDIFEEDDTIISNIFELYPQQAFDENSLKSPYQQKDVTPIENIVVENNISEKELDKITQDIINFMKNAPTQENINRFAKNILVNQDYVLASDLLKRDRSNLMKIMALSSYQESNGRNFDIIPLDENVTVRGVTFKDFKIKRKEGKKQDVV